MISLVLLRYKKRHKTDISTNSYSFIFFFNKVWVINSVGSECYLDRVEVTGSNPV